MKNKLIIKLIIKCLFLELDIRKLKSKNKKVTKERDEYEGNNEFLENENAILKQINRKRYLRYEDKMKFLIDREKKLQVIEQMVVNKTNTNKKIIEKIREGLV